LLEASGEAVPEAEAVDFLAIVGVPYQIKKRSMFTPNVR
jgi:hypothetical protein